MSSGFSTLSMKAGMGVPRTPVAMRVAISPRVAPPRKVQRLVRLAGLIGCPHSSFSSGREGPSARPWAPWHLLHSIASNISLPRLIDASEALTSFGRSCFLGASLNRSAAKVLRYATRFHRSLSGRTDHAGIDVPGMPLLITLNMSWSAGTLFAVERILYTPLVKSRGRGSSRSAAGPLPSPFSPWHRRHFRSYTALPALGSPWAETGGPHPTTVARSALASAYRRRLVRLMRRLPPSRLLAGGVVEVHDDLPDLLLGQTVFPGRHHGVPGRGLLGKSGPALGDAPKEIGLLEHGDGPRILEIRRRRVEPLGEVAFPVEIVAVAVHAVLDVSCAPGGHVLLEAG